MDAIQEISSEILRVQKKNLISVIATGSMLRAEQTVQGKILSDLDLIAVTQFYNPLLDRRMDQIAELYNKKMPFHVSIGAHFFRNFKKNKCLMLYEAKKNGRVVLGNPNVLQYISMNTPADIPRWEGIRLLFNRFFELLRAKMYDEDITYPIVKAYLAIGETYLLFNKRYKPTYRERLIEVQKKSTYPMNLFSAKFILCSEYKLNIINSIGTITFTAAMRDLIEAISCFLRYYSEKSAENPFDQINLALTRLEKQLYNPGHAAASFFQGLQTGKIHLSNLFKEPCITVWKRGINLLNKKTINKALAYKIIHDWETTNQPFVNDAF